MLMLNSICQEVVSLSKEVGEFIRSQRNVFNADMVEHKGVHDLVSYVDREAEKMIVKGLLPLIPHAGFITEENTVDQSVHQYQWIIDPLDGTTNFVHGLPCFCVSIALMDNQQLVLGVIYEINLQECFYAWKDGGAFLNGRSINVSNVALLNNSLIATGFPYTDYSRMKEYMQVFDVLMRQTHGLRRLGSAAVDMAYVACGRLEGFYEYGLNAWDIAAGAIIIQEAGGMVTDFSGGNNYLFGKEIVASNQKISSPFLDTIKKEFC